MTDTNKRTETAKRHDDSDLVKEEPDTPDQQGRAGGDVTRAVGTRDEHKRLDDPDTSTGVDKADELDGGTKPNETSGSG